MTDVFKLLLVLLRVLLLLRHLGLQRLELRLRSVELRPTQPGHNQIMAQKCFTAQDMAQTCFTAQDNVIRNVESGHSEA